MSRIGRSPINVPSGVTVALNNGVITVNGPKGTLTKEINSKVDVKIEGNIIHVLNNNAESDKNAKALHGLYRQLINNMIVGVSQGFEKRLNVNGVGYKVNLKNPHEVTLNIGFSHPVEVKAVDGITLEAEKNVLIVKGIDKEKVGQFASYVRGLKVVEPYHAYGISYSDEKIIRKETKTGKK